MSSKQPLISVIMTVFNGERFLAQAIDSILRQTFSDFEFFIADDGSTDNSLQIVESYARGDARIKVVRNEENCGVPTTSNRCIELARGQWIARMDADDVAKCDRLEKQITFLNDHPDCVLLGTDITVIDPYQRILRPWVKMPSSHEEIDRYLLDKGWPIMHPTVLISAEALRAVGGYDCRFRTQCDHDLSLKLSERGRVANLSSPLLFYRAHLENMSFSNQVIDHTNVDSIVEEALARRALGPRQYVKPGPSTIGCSGAEHLYSQVKWLQLLWALEDLRSNDRRSLRKVITLPYHIAREYKKRGIRRLKELISG